MVGAQEICEFGSVVISNQGMGERTPRGLLPVEWVFEHGSVDLWRDLCAPLFEVSQIHSELMFAQLSAHVWRVGPLVFWRSTCGGQVLHRRVEHLTEFGQHILVSRHRSGRIVGTTDCAPFQVQAGEIAIRDLGVPFSALQYPSVVESILIPQQFMAAPPFDAPTLQIFERQDLAMSPLQSLFATTFGALRASTDYVPADLIDRVLVTVKEVRATLGSTISPRRAARQSQRRAIQAYIEENLGRLDLCAETLLPHFGVSRATLYRMFEAYGGVRNYTVDRRLYHALLDISDSGARRGKIQLAAKNWGFSSAANFNRSVQHAFGGAPGSLFRPGPASDAVAEDAAPRSQPLSTQEFT